MANLLYDKLFGRHSEKSTPFLHLVNGDIISHAEFLARSSCFANLFIAMGLKPGDRVAVQIDKSPDAVSLYAACVQAGLIFLPLNTAYTSDEVIYFVENSGAALFVCQEIRSREMKVVSKSTGARLETLNSEGGGSLAVLADDQSDSFTTVPRNGDDLAALLYTSGTTGRSKGAMLTQSNLLSNAQTLSEFWHFTADDVLLHALPIFHTHGLFVALNITLLAGGSLIFMPKFDTDFLIKHMYRATTMMGVPTFYTRLLDDPRFSMQVAQHMRLFISGSAPLLTETHVAFEQRTGHRILERYGMTETNMNTSNPFEGERRAGTVGFPLPGVMLKITDTATGKTLPNGDIGQIEVSGPNVFKGYWKMPEKTSEELRENGFFITGDLGQIDEDGYLKIVGRDKDLIIAGGYNIYPKEIEMLINDQQDVLESAVIGIPHSDLGESIIALIVAEKGRMPDLEQISDNIAQSLAKFKQPSKLIMVAQLPRNTMGKVQKNVLRETYGTDF
jgi:malonyl-CoA/methylmalonyl-CoA synthetase